jgi:polar amino acid transport system substrate-binding protein
MGTACQGGGSGDLLDTVKARGEIVVSTDPGNAPQSYLEADNSLVGFDVDVANEIARRLGVYIKFETTDREAIAAGRWSGHWDISVGSMTITEELKSVLDFTDPYYYRAAQMAASDASGITSIDQFAGQTVCTGESTTYVDWLKGTLLLVDAPTPAEPPANITVMTLPTDFNCAEAWQASRKDFVGWISASNTVQGAIDQGIALHAVGDPVFYEPLAVAIDKSGPAHARLLNELNEVITAMHEDGTLTAFSEKWYNGLDLTTSP